MEENILVITTKLEKIFPCGFFDVMEHLPIHLVQDAHLEGIAFTALQGPTLQAIRRPRPLSANRISDGTPSPTAFVHSIVLTSSTVAPSATPDDEMPAIALGLKDRLDRVMIEPDGSSWHLAKDATRDLKDCVRRLYIQAYHSWSEIPNNSVYFGVEVQFVHYDHIERRASARLSSWIKKVWDTDQRLDWMLPHVFYDLRVYWNTYKFKAMFEQAKKARGSLKGGSLHTGGAKTVGTITREMEKELGRTPIESEVFKKTHVKKKENESDPDVWVEERAERTFNEFHQYVAENLDSSVQMTHELSTQIWTEKVIVAMSSQIAQLTSALTESKRRRVAEQQSMSATV
ncbi:hypothetical protein MTR67_003500 [Solanum verrucosum]|uniref:DUF4218 domain-containing protein n=1 Tax=Solanum verrucosum TaxID=315347 RepID=A0AAF0PUF0_SOLVR|nr:hypothetical protein MTR67_003500 [Solanum verrucosum]